MPTSITPPPAEDEIECGNCGAYIYAGLSRCSNCGINLYEPGVKAEYTSFHPKNKLSLAVESIMRKIKREPHPAEDLFSGALKEKALFDDLLRKVGGDRSVVERLVNYERMERPDATRLTCLQNAISRWEHENE